MDRNLWATEGVWVGIWGQSVLVFGLAVFQDISNSLVAPKKINISCSLSPKDELFHSQNRKSDFYIRTKLLCTSHLKLFLHSQGAGHCTYLYVISSGLQLEPFYHAGAANVIPRLHHSIHTRVLGALSFGSGWREGKKKYPSKKCWTSNLSSHSLNSDLHTGFHLSDSSTQGSLAFTAFPRGLITRWLCPEAGPWGYLASLPLAQGCQLTSSLPNPSSNWAWCEEVSNGASGERGEGGIREGWARNKLLSS